MWVKFTLSEQRKVLQEQVRLTQGRGRRRVYRETQKGGEMEKKSELKLG